MDLFWKLLFIAIICVVTIITWSKQREDETPEKEEENEFEKLGKPIADILDRGYGPDDLRFALTSVMMRHGMDKYKEGFENGQQIKLQEGLDMPEEVSKEIMKNQPKPVL